MTASSQPDSNRVSVLFVCLGNICRSPTAEAVFRACAEQRGVLDHLYIDSAGTAAYHVGNPPDQRAQRAGADRGFDLSPLRARQATVSDFEQFDHVLAMDEDNLFNLKQLHRQADQPCCTPELFLRYAEANSEHEVPDPYYGGTQGFEHVLDLCEAASNGFLDKLIDTHGWAEKPVERGSN